MDASSRGVSCPDCVTSVIEDGDKFINFLPSSKILQANIDNETAEYAPGLLMIGGDGGGEAFCIDMRKIEQGNYEYVTVPLIGMGFEDVVSMGSNVKELFEFFMVEW